MNINATFQLMLATVVALLPIINPFSTAPIFLAITEGYEENDRRRQARLGVMYMAGILTTFLIGGTFIMNFFGISIPGLRIAGGFMIAGVATRMLRPPSPSKEDRAAEKESKIKHDIAFTPLAMPSLSGPGSIAVTIGMTSLATRWQDYIGILLGILVMAFIAYAVLRLSTRIVKVLGVNGMQALTKIMGFLLLCVAVQFIVNGILGIVTDPDILRRIADAWPVVAV
jgi:multiple antibiotic resistance protein